LDDRFRLLTGGSRTAVPRHQTLRAAIDWSYALLSDKERVLLRRLAIFADSFTLEAAEEVCADEPESVPDGVSSADVLDLLSRLVDKSLVAVEDRGTEVRYELLQTIRQYGRDKLTESGEFAARRRRNLDFFLRLAERAEPELQGPDQKTWLDRLETEHDNFRAALTSPTAEESLSVLRLAGALWWFWYVRGYWTEGREQLERALAAGGQAPGPVRAKAMLGAGVLAWRQGDAARTQVLSQESLAMSQQLGDRRGAAYAMLGLGLSAQSQGEYQHAAELLVGSLDAFRAVGDKWGTALTTFAVGDIAAFQGDYARAAALKKESLALFQELGDRVGIAYSLRTLGIVTQYQGDYTRAWQLLDQSAGLFRELGDQGDTAYVLHDLGQVAQLQGDYARAVSLHQESLALNQKLGNKGGTALALYDLATAAEAQGDAARALNLFRRSLALRRDLGDRLGIVECLERLAGAAALQPGAQTAARAARWFGAAAALREATGASMSPGERADYERRVHAARDALGEPAFDAAWQAGRTLSQEEAVGEASAPDDAK
jgi:tetratricopeptide (TPR) repeat protein